MNRPFYFGFVSNASPFVRSRVVESLISVWTEDKSVNSVFIDFDTGISLRKKAGRSSGEDTISRYGNVMGPSAVPVLRLNEAVQFFDDASKPKNYAQVEGRSFVMLMNEVPTPITIPLFDVLCFSITLDPASIAFVYGALKSMESAGKHIPVRILIIGESKIEKAAEFYVLCMNELKNVGDKLAEISFAGFLSFDQEELDLCVAYGVPVTEAYPEGTLYGQVKYAIRKLFVNDFSEIDSEWPEREKQFACIARSMKR